MFHDHGQGGVLGIQHHGTVRQRRQVGHLRDGGVEHRCAFRQHHVHLGAHHLGHLVLFVHVEFGQRFHAVHVGDHTHLAAVVGQAVAQNGARVAFDHGGLHGLVHQQAVGGFPMRAIGRFDAAAVQEQPFAAGQARVVAAQVQQPGHDPRDG
ncbi:hypothetical protein D3C71_1244130 [compost metagenome]